MTQRIAQFVADMQLQDIPANVVEAATVLFKDTLAVAWAGTGAPGVTAARALALANGGNPESRLWSTGEMLPATEVAFANAAAAAALDYDSVHQGSILHADATVIPAAFALAERRGASGAEFLAASIAGIELAHRLSIATPRQSGWFQSSTLGVFGAAAAAARLLGLDAARTGHALGIALSMSAGTKQAIVERTLTKRLQTAFASRAGVQAALLASQGVTGPERWLDGPYGWFTVYEGGSVDAVTDGLGERFVSIDTGIKKFPCCLCSHAAIEATLALVRDLALRPEDIVSMRVTISPYMHRIVGAPYEPDADAQVAAQFSIQYAVACAALRHQFTLAELDTTLACDPSLRKRAQSVTVDVEKSWPGQTAPAEVSLETRTHGIVSRRVDELPGTRANPLTRAELDRKFHDCVGRGALPLTVERIDALGGRCDAIAHCADVRTLLAPLFVATPVIVETGVRADATVPGLAD